MTRKNAGAVPHEDGEQTAAIGVAHYAYEYIDAVLLVDTREPKPVRRSVEA